MDEQEAIHLLRQGELQGLEALVQRYQAPAVQAAYLITADRAAAEDCVQAAFLQAALKIGQYDPARPFAPWLFRIVVNSALKDQARSRRLAPLDPPEAAGEGLLDPGCSPEELASQAEARREVWLALQKLSAPERAAVVMRYFLEMPEKEISAELNRPLTTVKWTLHAARERLRRSLAPRDPRREAPGGPPPQENLP